MFFVLAQLIYESRKHCMTPSRRFLIIVAAWTALGFATSLFPRIEWLQASWWAFGLVLLLGALLDAVWSYRPVSLRIERRLAGVLPVDVWTTVSLILHNEGQHGLRVQVFDDYPHAWQFDGLPYVTKVPRGEFRQFDYRVRANVRGDARFGLSYARVSSPLGLWQRVHRLGEISAVKVFPDFSKLLGQTLNATDRRSPTAGAIRKRRRGEGTDFRQLREYRQGDSQRSIDWKATARHQKPITREYQEERDQQVVFLIDTGRRMLAQDGVSSHFDHALNAVLTLSFVAQKQGDAVGLMSFGSEGNQDTRWISPQKGRTGLDRILSGVYDLQAHEVAPDYTLAATSLLNKLSKRAFVVVITNLRDEDDQAMRNACELLSTKHLVMCASLREKSLDAAVQAPVQQFNDALRYSAAAHYLQQRHDAIRRLGIRASHLIDITPELLSRSLIDRYLTIKESGAL
jgi:uncharacterized protein (DUF58 family)